MEMETERLVGTDNKRIVWGLQISIHPEHSHSVWMALVVVVVVVTLLLLCKWTRHFIGFILHSLPFPSPLGSGRGLYQFDVARGAREEMRISCIDLLV